MVCEQAVSQAGVQVLLLGALSLVHTRKLLIGDPHVPWLVPLPLAAAATAAVMHLQEWRVCVSLMGADAGEGSAAAPSQSGLQTLGFF